MKEAPIQPKLVTEWTPPVFSADVSPAPPFPDVNGKLWSVSVAACLCRYPRITRDKTKEELEYSVFREKVILRTYECPSFL